MKNALLLSTALALVAGAVWAQSPGVNSPFNPVWSIPLDSIKRTYSVAVSNLSPSAVPATDVMQICGSSSATIRLTRVLFSGRATAVTPVDVVLNKRSTADTGGTVATNPTTAVPYDANIAAATAAITAWNSNPTTGTLVGPVAIRQYYLGNLTTGTSGPTADFDFGDRPGSAIVLRGAAQCVAVSLSPAASPAGSVLDLSAEWTEE